jgi:serine/threonine protein kinase/Tfp pilus assembly protein PilF
MESLVGQTIAHYKIVGLLGTGGMGSVYEAEDSELGRRVAIKALSADLKNDAPMLERFKREARAASALNHPGICTVYAIEQHEGQPFIAMELIKGSTLAEKMGRQPFEVHEVLDLGVQIADALESAHSKGIAHRDLKPANIMINDRGQVKILDFGLAKVEVGILQKGEEVSKLETAISSGPLTMAGTVMGTVHYMSPEQARGQLTDARTDLFSLGAVLYQMATGELPFPGDTQAVIFDAILNRDPLPLSQVNPALPAELGRIIGKLLEKDRNLRCQTAAELKTDFLRLKRDLDSGPRRAAELLDSKGGAARPSEKSVAVLYFENLSGVKEDEYFRDGITEDIITELTKIKGLRSHSRATVLSYRDKPVTPAQIGQQLGAAYILTGSLRRAGNRLRINAQLVDTHTDFPLWSERYDREMQDVFEVQDEIARKIAEALRITLSPQEQQALADKPTDDLQAYDLYLRGRNYARRSSRQDLEFALQMYENAVALDPKFALAYAAMAHVCAQYHYHFDRDKRWIDRAVEASGRASSLGKDLPEVRVAQAWVAYAEGKFDEAVDRVRGAIERKPDCEGAYYLLGRTLFALGRYQEVADMAEEALAASGDDYNVYVPIHNSLSALGKADAVRNLEVRRVEAFESHLKKVPEDARARTLLALSFIAVGRPEDASREAALAMALRPDDAMVLYNVACIYCGLGKNAEAMDALSKAWDAGFRDPNWARHDPDLEPLRENPEFERLFPAE